MKFTGFLLALMFAYKALYIGKKLLHSMLKIYLLNSVMLL